MQGMADDDSPILVAARTGNGLQHYTVEQLGAVCNEKGQTALSIAAWKGHLDKIKGGATAVQLAAARSKDNLTALHVAAGYRHLDQIAGGVTVEQLLATDGGKDYTALDAAALHGSLDQVTPRVTFQQLAESVKSCRQAVYFAAEDGHFDQLEGGVTAKQILAYGGPGLMEILVGKGHLDQLVGGATLADLGVRDKHHDPLLRLRKMIRFAEEKKLGPLTNDLVAFPEAIVHLDHRNLAHKRIVRDALSRNRKIEEFLSPEWTSEMLAF